MANLYTKTVVAQNNNIPDFKVQRYRGFSTVSRKSKNFALYDFELIKQDILNHFYTRQGERLMQPAFGTIIWDLIFEPLTDEIQNLILQNVNEIFNSDPRVQAGNILITPYETGLEIQCTLQYVLYNIQESMQLKFDQANGLTT
jgi:phage baseplate assembly protein W